MQKIVTENNHAVEPGIFQKALLSWGEQNFRPFPWRATDKPFYILLSELMLHRTQAKQVVPVYKNFIERFPDIETLSKASKAELQQTLYSLGLRWRIDLIYQMTKEIVTKFDGIIPQDKEELLSLSGISEYIAGALRCFSWNLPEPIADTNTIRIVGRIFGLETKDSSRRNRIFKSLLAELVPIDRPREYNYALLDLADKICTKKPAPDCPNCPLISMCQFGQALQN
ncbi:MAG: DNA-binding protein [Anaerolineales bacterium]|nr:DNA-binding protein [Anaerolineales bacterium]